MNHSSLADDKDIGLDHSDWQLMPAWLHTGDLSTTGHQPMPSGQGARLSSNGRSQSSGTPFCPMRPHPWRHSDTDYTSCLLLHLGIMEKPIYYAGMFPLTFIGSKIFLIRDRQLENLLYIIMGWQGEAQLTLFSSG